MCEKLQQDAFDSLQSLITSAPVLAYFDNKKEAVLKVDASANGLGAVILQGGEPINFSLLPVREDMSTFLREC